MSIEDVLEQAAHGSEQSKEIEATDTGMQAEAVQAPVSYTHLEMLFTHYGVTGPVILSASSVVGKTLRKKELTLHIDLKPCLLYTS